MTSKFVKLKDLYINVAHVSMVALKPDNTIVVDFNYSTPEGAVFVARSFDTAEEATAALDAITTSTADKNQYV